MSGKFFQTAVRYGRNSLYKLPSRAILQRQQFASSAILQKAIPVFTKTSSVELDSMLERFRMEYLLPKKLTPEQISLIHSPESKETLEKEPVIVDVEGEEIKLQHVNPRDRLTAMSIVSIARLMKTEQDWKNFEGTLDGFNINTTGHDTIIQRAITQAGECGQLYTIIKCAQKASETGLYLSSPAVVLHLMTFIARKAYSTSWNAAETKEAWKWMEIVAETMEGQEHVEKRRGGEDMNPANRPEIVGLLLQFAAVSALKYGKGADSGGKVAKYAEQLLATPLEFTYIGFQRRGKGRVRETIKLGFYIRSAAPVLHGMKAAQQVLGPDSELSSRLGAEIPKLEASLSGWVEEYKQEAKHDLSTDKTLAVYEQFMGAGAE